MGITLKAEHLPHGAVFLLRHSLTDVGAVSILAGSITQSIAHRIATSILPC